MNMSIKKYQGTAAHFVAAYVLAVLGIGLIVTAMFLPPVGYIDPTVLAAFGELLSFCAAVMGLDYQYRKSMNNNQTRKEG